MPTPQTLSDIRSKVPRSGVAACWLAPLVLLVVDLPWALSAKLHVTGWLQPAFLALLLLAVGLLCRTSNSWAKVGDMVNAAGAWIGFTATGCVLTYLAARSALPLRDDALEAADRALGFDWQAWSSWVHAHPILHFALALSYMSLPVQIVGVCWLLPLLGGSQRLTELLWGALVAILIATVFSALVPALGAFPHYGLTASADWLPDLVALRSPGPVTVTLGQMKGIIAWPSYHAALAVLFVYTWRRSGIIGHAVTALNLLMLTSTMSEGSHYLCDVIAGCIVAAVSIWTVRVCSRLPPFRPEADLTKAVSRGGDAFKAT